MNLVYIFVGILCFLIVVAPFYFDYKFTRNNMEVKYKTIDISYYKNGHDLEKFRNISQYKIDKYGRITFVDNDGILHCDISYWRLLRHSED